MRSRPIVCALALASTGCFGEFVPPVSAEGSSTGTALGNESTADASTSTDGGSESTAAAPTRLPDELGCHVNVLFVIDLSNSMSPFAGDFLDSLFGLSTTFPKLLAEFESYHIGFTTNSVVPWNDVAYVPEGGTRLDCTGSGSLSRPLDLDCYEAFNGRSYLTEATDLSDALECLANDIDPIVLLGEELEVAMPLAAIENALSSELNEPGACNAGFYREDQPLVIVIVTDSDDDSGMIVPAGPSTALLAKVGDPRRLAISMIAGPACSCNVDNPPACSAECPPELDFPPQPPCTLLTMADLLFPDGLEDNLQFTDICTTTEDGSNPYGTALGQALADQANRVCDGAAAVP